MSTPPVVQEPAEDAVKVSVTQAMKILSEEDVRLVLAETAEKLERKRRDEGEAGPVTDADLLLELARELKNDNEFGFARRILSEAEGMVGAGDTRLKVFQEWAICTYKDPDLPAERRLKDALARLKKGDDLKGTTNQETLGIAGAIHKRLWEFGKQREELRAARDFYRRGRMQGVARDKGYTAVNEAYLLDLLASLEEDDGHTDEAAKMRAEAVQIREEIIRVVPSLAETPKGASIKNQWWYYSTVGEAYFGLRRYQEAAHWLVDAKPAALKPADWEYESTARQLASLAQLQYGADMPAERFAETEAGAVLKKFFGSDDLEAVMSAYVGKIGLALSGGGFRASLFHIGVLARLAELDLLRRVEVLSCVSGGSIVGAHYYLEVRRLLQSKPDKEITRNDYIQIVKNVECDFLAGVQSNVRTRVAASLLSNLKLIFLPGYSRTLRAGELYEREIFSKVKDEGYGRKRRKFWLGDLRIEPAGVTPRTFNPKFHNWRRAAKAPMLILNAATLNTGHNWHFTVTYMGEPPGSIDPEIDGNYRLRRMYYRHAPFVEGNWLHRVGRKVKGLGGRLWAKINGRAPAEEKRPWRSVRLGHAVAASASVPAIFEPLALDFLYEDAQPQPNGRAERLRVRLVDGGVCDNQGVMGLTDAGCSVLLVSDASGQMEVEPSPGSGLLSVPIRSSSVLQARIRGAQYRDLRERRRAGLLRGLMFVHLKQDLGVSPLKWLGCKPHLAVSDFDHAAQRKGVATRYGVMKHIQRSLAAIRTDLDSFSDVEADALMASGYLMTKWRLATEDDEGRRCVDGLDLSGRGHGAKAEEVEWRFSHLTHFLGPVPETKVKNDTPEFIAERQEQLKKIVDAGGSLAFKAWKLSTALKVLSVLVAAFLITVAVGALVNALDVRLLTPDRINWLSDVVPRQLAVLSEVLTIGRIAGYGLLLLVALFGLLFLVNLIGKKLLGVVRWSDTLSSIAFGVVMTPLGYVAAWVHLIIFDPFYLYLCNRNRFYGDKRAQRQCGESS
jgi:predicted acylesterase/phospholipase RssA